MPDFDFIITYHLEVSGTITLKAKDDEAATEKLEEMIADEKAGFVSWKIKDAKGPFAKMGCEEDLNEVEFEIQ